MITSAVFTYFELSFQYIKKIETLYACDVRLYAKARRSNLSCLLMRKTRIGG